MPFKKGNPGGPGRPKKSTEDKYLRRLSASVNMRDWESIIDRAIYDAKKGDTAARKWLADYLVGLPVQRMEYSGSIRHHVNFLDATKGGDD